MIELKIKVEIDRPIGFKDTHNNIYPINYGYVPHLIGGDEEEQDVYVLDVNEPIDVYEGDLVAIIHRNDDVEEKWVVSNRAVTLEEVKEKTHFIEQYFDSTISLVDEFPYELWDVVDEQGSKLGYQKVRGSKLLDNEYHQVVHVWIVQSDGRYLLQRRSYNKSNAPGYIAAHAGSVTAGEDVFTGAIREVEEEIGIRIPDDKLEFVAKLNPFVRGKNGVDYLFVSFLDIELNDCILDEVEVDSIMYMTQDEILDAVKTGEFYPYGETYFNSIFNYVNK